jgi:hypothetical protein
VYTLNAEFSETTTNWNNQPGMLIPYSDFSVPSDQVVHSLEVSTPTQTKTPGPVTVNLEAIQLEVTQGLQDAIDNHVRLVEGKRTFARFHVFADDTAPAPGKQYRATAALQIWRGGTFLGTLKPINNAAGVINVPPSTFDPSTWPPRVDDSFLFELPNEQTNGTLRLVAQVDPDDEVDETDDFWDNDEETVNEDMRGPLNQDAAAHDPFPSLHSGQAWGACIATSAC